MKQILYFILSLVVCLALPSCSSDEESGEGAGTKYDNEKLKGEWCCINGNDITYISLQDPMLATVNGYEIGGLTTSLYDSNNGNATWGVSDGSLRIKYISSFSGNQVTHDYKIQRFADYGFTAHQADLDLTFEFSRIVTEKTTSVGEIFKFEVPSKYQDFIPYTFTSSDSRIASVDAEGNVKINKCGTAFIFANSSVGSLVCKVETPAPKDEMIPQCFMTDMFLTLDEFRENHPDYFMLDPDYSDGTLYFLPSDPKFSSCLGYFDTTTGEIYTMFYFLKNPNDREQIGNYLGQVMVSVINKSGNTVYTETGSLQDYTLGAYFSDSESGTYLRFVNNKWYSRK